MISAQHAYDILVICIRAIAGRTEPLPHAHDKLDDLGISTAADVKHLTNLIASELATEGYEFAKMSLDSVESSSTVADVVHLATHATPKSRPTMY
jgi:CHAT domain-containing protein